MDADAFNAFEASGWEGKAAAYDAFFGPVTGRGVEPLLDAAGVRSGTRVLDLATGPGYVAARAVERGATPVGVDVAESMLTLARRRHPGLEFRRGEAEALPFPDASFDAAVGNFAILHIGRPERAVTELARVLAPGGNLALSTWDVPERARLLGVFVDAVAAAGASPSPDVPAGPDFFRFSDEEEFATLLRDRGLERIEVATVGFTHAISTPGALWDGMLAATVRTSTLIVAQAPVVQRRIRAEFDRLVAPHRAPDGSLRIPVFFKLVSGVTRREDLRLLVRAPRVLSSATPRRRGPGRAGLLRPACGAR